VGEDGVLACGDADGLEADAAAVFADLLGVETGEAKVLKAFDQAKNAGGLTA
jgi:hypothetical protein